MDNPAKVPPPLNIGDRCAIKDPPEMGMGTVIEVREDGTHVIRLDHFHQSRYVPNHKTRIVWRKRDGIIANDEI